MSTTLNEIVELLEKCGYPFGRHEYDQTPVVLVKTSHYLNSEQQPVLSVFIQVIEEGRIVKFFCPAAYHIPLDTTGFAALKTFASISWKVRLVNFQVDIEDGEVRPSIHIPVEDTSLTPQQLQACLENLSVVVDLFDPYIRHALIYGEVHDRILTGDALSLLQESIDALDDSDDSDVDISSEESEPESEESSSDDSENPDDEWM